MTRTNQTTVSMSFGAMMNFRVRGEGKGINYQSAKMSGYLKQVG